MPASTWSRRAAPSCARPRSWVGARRLFRLSLFLTRVPHGFTQDPSTDLCSRPESPLPQVAAAEEPTAAAGTGASAELHTRSVLGSWVGVRRLFQLSLFLTAPRMVLPQDPSTDVPARACPWQTLRGLRGALRCWRPTGRPARLPALLHRRQLEWRDTELRHGLLDGQVSTTRILGRRTAPFTAYLIPNRVPHGVTPRS